MSIRLIKPKPIEVIATIFLLIGMLVGVFSVMLEPVTIETFAVVLGVCNFMIGGLVLYEVAGVEE